MEASRKRASGKKTGKNKKSSLREGRLHPERGKIEKVDDGGGATACQHTETTTDREPRNENHGPIPPPTVPLRVLPMGPPGGVPLAGYTLRPHLGGTGVVMCDPSTGVPLMRSSGGVPLVGWSAGVPSGLQMVPPSIPPVIHMPTAIPLGHTPASPTVPPPPPPPAPVSAAQSEDQQERAASTGGPSVADVALQTSFTAEKTPHLVQEVSIIICVIGMYVSELRECLTECQAPRPPNLHLLRIYPNTPSKIIPLIFKNCVVLMTWNVIDCLDQVGLSTVPRFTCDTWMPLYRVETCDL